MKATGLNKNNVAAGEYYLLSASNKPQKNSKMSFRRLSPVLVRFISRSSVHSKLPSAGSNKKDPIRLVKVNLPVETDTKKLVEYVCGTNLLSNGGEDVKIKPDSEYPEWLWEMRTPPPLHELDPNTKAYWLKVMRQRLKEKKYLNSFDKTRTVHK